MSSKESFSQISPSEFFYRNRDLAGFSNPTRSLYTAVREFVENSLDACDQQGILPDVHMSIKAVDAEKPDPKHYILTVRDNGPGIESKHVPLAFGTVLYGSKFGLKQARGMFGLGATMAILYGQITTNKPVIVKSSTDGKTQDEYEMLLDIQKNKPVILKHETKEVAKGGLSLSIRLEGDYAKAGSKIRDYVYQTSLITPYATITFDDPKGDKYRYTKVIRTMPPSPTIIRPHPHGIDVETIRRMLLDTHYQIPAVDDNMISKVRKELGLTNKSLGYSEVMNKTEKKWKTLTRPVRIVMALMSFLKMDFEKLSKTTIEEIDIGNKKLTYWDFGESQSIHRIGTMTNQELVKLTDGLQSFDDFMAPDPSCLAPLGESPLKKGMERFFEPDFLEVVQRGASAYSGFPFVIEMGIAYGGKISSRGMKVYRFANRIPLLYDEGSDVVLKVVNDTDWSRYKVKGDPPLVIVSHICSTRVPYKTVGKENVADRPEIERELKLALLSLSRKLSSFMSKRGQAEAAIKRKNLYSKYIPLIAQFCTELAGKKKEPNYKKMITEEPIVEEKI